MKGRVLVKEYLCSVLSLTQRVVMLLHLPFILQHDDVILLTIDLLRNRFPDPALKPPSMDPWALDSEYTTEAESQVWSQGRVLVWIRQVVRIASDR